MELHSPRTIPDKVITTEVLNDFERVRSLICRNLEDGDTQEKIKALFQDVDRIQDGTILDIIYEVSRILSPEIFMSVDSQLFFSQRQLGAGSKSGTEISHDTFISLQNLIVVALVDIFYLVCLHVNSKLNPQKLKGLLHLNMQYGGATGINTLFGENENIMFNNNWEESYNILRGNTSIYEQEPIDISTVGKETKDYVSQTVCPFRYNEARGIFIDEIWDFFHQHIIPILQEKFQESPDTYEMFFSGNLGNTLQR